MNAIQIIESVRAHDADLIVEDGELVVRGRGQPLPEELQTALRQHKAELLVALGATREVSLVEVLRDLRPHLPPALRRLPDASLLVLVNWSMLHAWNRALGQLHSARRPGDTPAESRQVTEDDQPSLFERNSRDD